LQVLKIDQNNQNLIQSGETEAQNLERNIFQNFSNQSISSNGSGTIQYTVNSKMPFIGQQQQLNNDNHLNVSSSLNITLETKQAPGKKLKKKQLLQQSLTDDSDTSPTKITQQRKIRPKKDSLSQSLSSSSSVTDISINNNSSVLSIHNSSIDTSINNNLKLMNEQNSNTEFKMEPGMSATNSYNIEATIDDLMKQYKVKEKKNTTKLKDESKLSGNDSDDEQEDEYDKDDKKKEESFKDSNIELCMDNEKDENLKTKKHSKSPKRTPKKKTKTNEINGELNDTVNGELTESENSAKKKRKYTKKKATILQMDELSMSVQEGFNQDSNIDTLSITKTKINEGEESLSMTLDATNNESLSGINKKPRAKKTPKDLSGDIIITTNKSSVGRKKSLVKLMKKNQRKKRKRTSSGEEIDDDSDDFEISCSTAAVYNKANNKKEESSSGLNDGMTNDGSTNPDTTNNDEAAAKLLQANESRRSTRNKASKRTKYADDDYKLRDEDLIMPPTEADLAIEAAEAALAAASQNSNIVLTSQDSLIVDKILGMRLYKRKTKRKKEKITLERKLNENEIKPEETKAEELKAEELKAEETKAEETKAEELKAEETKVEETKVEETKVEELKAEETKAEELKAEETKAEELKAEETKVEEMKAEQVNSIEKIEENKEVNNENLEVDKKDEKESETRNQSKVILNESNIEEETKIVEKEFQKDNCIEDKNLEKLKIESEEKSKHEETSTNTSEQKSTIQNEEKIMTPVKDEYSKKIFEIVENPENELVEDEESEYEEDGGEVEVEEFFVKYKNFSYVHCEWRTRDELFISDKRVDQKIKRFKLKKSQQNHLDWNENENGYNNDDEELFNPDYIEVDRILDVFDMEDAAKPNAFVRYYLVKWKALSYDESSWELEQDVKNTKKIERFYKFNTMVSEIHQRYVPKPKPDRWNQLKESRIYKNGNSLREYQLEGINWLTFCWLNARNCILADEMGLGKTVQSITFLQEIAHYGVNGPWLILVPLSTIGNWIREFETWTDFNAIVYHGSASSRQMLQDYEFYFKENGTSPNVSNSIAINPDASKKNIVKFNALITTYEVLLSDVTLFGQFKWRNVIIDEAHRLKNKNCKLMEGLRLMDVEHKVLLTGTPLQNNVEELFSLLHFLEPQQFHSNQEFMEEFGDLKTDTQVTKLQAVLKPMMLRRLKEDVEKNLAAKEETIVEVELTNTQKKYYRAILEKNFEFLYKGASNSNMPNLMNTMMELRKCCNHPYLINGKLLIN